MDGLNLSDVALEALSDSDLSKIAKQIGMTAPRQKDDREQTLKRIRARRDHPVRSGISGRRLEQVCCTISGRFAASAEMI